MGLFGGDSTSVSNTTTNQKDNKATTQTGDAYSSGGGVQNITDGGAYAKSVNAFSDIFGKQMQSQKEQQKGIFDQTNKLVDLTGNLLQRKSESDSKELTEKAMTIGGFVLGLFFITRIFK